MENTDSQQQKSNDLKTFIGTCVGILAVAIIIWAVGNAPAQIDTNQNSAVQTPFYTKATANIRSCDSLDCAVVATYPAQTEFKLPYLSQDLLPDWVYVSYVDTSGATQTGYISKTMLTGRANSDYSATTKISPNNSVTTKLKSQSLQAIIQEWRRRTAYVECDWYNNNDITAGSYYADGGSGMLYNDRDTGLTVLTNAHVVNNSTYGAATACYVKFPDDTGAYGPILNPNIQILDGGVDGGYLLHIRDLPFYESASITLTQRVKSAFHICTQREQIGDSVVVLGYPDYGSAIEAVGNIEVTATEGIISGKDRQYYTTSAQIEHGYSGGIAVDEANHCYVGIPSAFVLGEAGSLGRILPASFVLMQQAL